ncbi:MAG: hypothetical protein AAFX52_13280 [Pseudomonadota bacterium]
MAIPFALPGEEVRVVVRGKRADVLARLSESTARHSPVCQHFGLPGDGCGGCTLQHWGEEAALTLKAEKLLAALRQSYPYAEINCYYRSPPKSRRRAKFAVTPQGVGFHRLSSREVVHLRTCDVLQETIVDLIKPLAALARDKHAELPPSFDAQATLTETGIDLAFHGVDEAQLSFAARERLAAFAEEHDLARLSADGVTAAERRVPLVTLGGVSVALPAGAFLQATKDGEVALTKEVLDAAVGAERPVDLYCGIGTFALPLSDGRDVVAVEGYGPAIDVLQTAAKAADRNVAALKRDLVARPLQASELQEFDMAVFDPPRAGAFEQARALSAARVPTIVAVSCNPATLGRDVSMFAADYDLTRLVMVDQFGWSSHIEAVAVFHRRT